MSVWAIADLHLSLSNPEKDMAVFGQQWEGYISKMALAWDSTVKAEDLVLIPGDISWALKTKEAHKDLEWIHQRPGKKLMLKGNHDYWWPSSKKLQEILPPSISFIQNNSFDFEDIAIAGSRLWDNEEFNFNDYVEFRSNKVAKTEKKYDSKHIFEKEIKRLTISLEQLNTNASIKIAMTHYPPISADLKPSKLSILFEQYGINICVFGHLHNLKPNLSLFGKKNNIRYILTAADYIDFKPIKII